MTPGRLEWSSLPLLFAFQGRIDRGKFWGGHALLISVVAVVYVVGRILVVLILDPETYDELEVAENLWRALCLLSVLLFAFSSMALHAKRLHDIGESGWWALAIFVPIVGLAVFLRIGCMAGEKPRADTIL